MANIRNLFSGYSLKYSVTEWGFSPNSSSVYGCGSADQKSQAIYFMRRLLMDATMLTNDSVSPKPWSHSIYYQYSCNDDAPDISTGWYSDNTHATPRAISFVGQTLLSDISGKPSLYPGMKIWKKPAFEIMTSPSTDRIIRCGWINSQGERWYAIWRYKHESASFDDFPESSQTFTINNENPGIAKVYKFSFGSPSTYNNTSFSLYGSKITPTPSGNNWQYTVPCVDENPTFLYFE